MPPAALTAGTPGGRRHREISDSLLRQGQEWFPPNTDMSHGSSQLLSLGAVAGGACLGWAEEVPQLGRL